MSDGEIQKYNFMYAQRLEILLHEQIRKTIDAEVRLSMLNDVLEQEKQKFDESQKQVAIQNDIMNQAAVSIESLTIDKKNLESSIENLVQNINDLESFKDSSKQKDMRIKELEREIQRQNKELQTTFDDLQKIKDEPKKPVIKNKKSVEDDGTF